MIQSNQNYPFFQICKSKYSKFDLFKCPKSSISQIIENVQKSKTQKRLNMFKSLKKSNFQKSPKVHKNQKFNSFDLRIIWAKVWFCITVSWPVIVRLSSSPCLTCETSQKGYFMSFYGFHITCKYGSIDVVVALLAIAV